MSSSVLWVFLIAVWLFILVPMVLRGRPEVRKTTQAAADTRLLHRGGTRAATPRRRAAGRHPSRPDYVVKRTKVTAQQVDADDAEVLDAELVESDADEKVTVQKASDLVTDVVEAEVVEADSAEAEVVDAEVAEGAADDSNDVDDSADEVDAELDEADETGEAEFDEEAEFDDLDDEADFEDVLDEDGEEDAELDDLEDPAPRVASRESRGWGGYGRDYVQQREQMRYRERQRVVAGLAALTLLAAVSCFFWQPAGFVALGAVLLVSGAYLFFLRKAVAAENVHRAQRVARMQRRMREDERLRREQSGPGYRPARLRRPGGAVVLELDDEDPSFEHLPVYDFAEGAHHSERDQFQRAV